MAATRVRQLVLQLLTGAATVALLAALTMPALRTLRTVADTAIPAEPARAPAPAPHPRRIFGIYVDPWHAGDWSRAIGAAPQALGTFEAFSRGRTLQRLQDESARRGIRRILVSWEPWTPVPSALGVAAQARPQRGLRNIDIARGAQDRYVIRFARTLARFPGTVYLRFAHEMNGYWYPWSHDPAAYRWAWRRVVRLFRAVGARNVRFVWSANANLYEGAGRWRAGLRRYWPGRRFVDVVGGTMINFGGSKDYEVSRFVPRLTELHRRYGKPIFLTETNTAEDGAALWLRALRGMLAGMPWVRGVFWSQLPSRGKAQQTGTGALDWDVRQDPESAAELSAIIRDGASAAATAARRGRTGGRRARGGGRSPSARSRACGRCS
jgi:mannan endo-1,4-beta-mannosidase